MADIRTNAEIAAKWARVTPQRTADYERGVTQPRKDWAAATGASNQAWKDGVQSAVAADRFAKGVRAAGTSKWQEGAVNKGVPRWGPGVQIGESAYATGFQPYRDAIERVTLPPRFARRDPRNLLRVNAVVDALIKTKTAQSSG